ncbi:MAG: hypothetical protein ACRD0V_06240 [Acidimicrobiales bacterium]
MRAGDRQAGGAGLGDDVLVIMTDLANRQMLGSVLLGAASGLRSQLGVATVVALSGPSLPPIFPAAVGPTTVGGGGGR